MSHTPTAEQDAIRDAFSTGANLVIEAGAGTGKTSTLRMLAADAGRRRGVYLAFNKAIADEAGMSFPSSVQCRTAHSLAYGVIGRDFRHRLNGPRRSAQDNARTLKINEPVQLAEGKGLLAPQQLARLVTETIGRYCFSADDRITARHVARVNGLEPAEQQALATYLAPIAQRAWDEDITQTDGQLRFTHDMYLKMWCLTRPQLSADYVLLDEAQDSNPAVAALVEGQADAQQILVGDRNQAIYGWRGAQDAMQHFDGKRLYLSQSFRFGPAIADEANKWLGLLDAPLRLTGYAKLDSRVDRCDDPDAILCRSNGGAMVHVMDAVAQDRRVALVGGGEDIRRMALAAQKLKLGQPTDHPELFTFATWAEVQAYVAEGEGSDLRVMVKLIDTWGTRAIVQACDYLVDERYAGLVVSTAHKAKGREWGSVRIATDFPEPTEGEDGRVRVSREDAMLAYVSVTRAKLLLDPEGLAWIDRYATTSTWRPTQPSETPGELAPESVPPQPIDALADDDWPEPVPVAPASVDVPPHHDLSPSGWLQTLWCQRCQQPGQSYLDCGCRLGADRQVRLRRLPSGDIESDQDVLARLLTEAAVAHA